MVRSSLEARDSLLSDSDQADRGGMGSAESSEAMSRSFMMGQRRDQRLNRTHRNVATYRRFSLNALHKPSVIVGSGHHFEPALREYRASQPPLGSAQSHPVSRPDAAILALAGFQPPKSALVFPSNANLHYSSLHDPVRGSTSHEEDFNSPWPVAHSFARYRRVDVYEIRLAWSGAHAGF